MPISVKCPNCGKGIKAPDAAAGKQAPCPACKQPFLIQAEQSAPAPSSQPGPAPAPASDNPFAFDEPGGTVVEQAPVFAPPPSQAPAPSPAPAPAPAQDEGPWHVTMPDGQQYGPISKTDLDAWVADGRITEGCQLFCTGWQDWKPYAEVYGAGAAAAVSQPEVSVNVKELVRDEAGNVELGWHFVSKGLRITQIALIVGAVAMLMSAVGMFLMKSALSSMRANFQEGAGKMEFGAGLATWGESGFNATFVAVVIGWYLCFSIPRRAKSSFWLIVALATVGAAFGFSFFANIAPTSIFSPGSVRPGAPDLPILPKLMTALMFLCWMAALALFAFFISQTAGGYFRQRAFPLQSLIFMGFAGVVAIWAIVFVFVFIKVEAMVSGSFFTCGGITYIAIAAACGWLCFLTMLLMGTVNRAMS